MADLEVRDIEEYILKTKNNQRDKLYSSSVLKLLIDGVCEEECTLSVFVGVPHVIYTIWKHLVAYWKQFILEGDFMDYDGLDFIEIQERVIELKERHEFNGFTEIDFSRNIAFAELFKNSLFESMKANNIHINMMPFVMEKTFEKCRLPEYLRPYWENVINQDYGFQEGSSTLIPELECGKIGFLTIHESYVEADKTQRRPGLHTDCPGKLALVQNEDGYYTCEKTDDAPDKIYIGGDVHKRGNGAFKETVRFRGSHPWGGGCGPKINGGIFMMSDVDSSCEVYNCRIIPDENGNEIIGHLGDVSHLWGVVPYDSETMKANTMYWLTDRTPHVALPLEKSTYRKYFRLVTSEVSIWYEDHSTKNPLGVTPDPYFTKIIKGSKF